MLEEEELRDAVLVVLANKQDIEGAMSVTEVHGALGLDKLKNRTFQIFKVIINHLSVSSAESPGQRNERRGTGREHGVAEQYAAEQEIDLL
jgi:hypothetical protein